MNKKNLIGSYFGALLERGAYLVGIVMLSSCLITDSLAQKAEVIRSSDFVLTDSQAAAGIDGRIKISLEVDDKGNVKDAEVIAGPIWPCDRTPKSELNEFKKAAVQTARMFQFVPLIKDGKSAKSTIILTFIVGNAYKATLEAKDINAKFSQFKDAGVVNGRAIKLPRPRFPMHLPANVIPFTDVAVDIIVSPDGTVVAAGTLTGAKEFHETARDAACGAKFSPTTIDGNPISITGRIVYHFAPR